MTKLFKALGATLLAAGLVVAGVAAPAQAAVSLTLSSNTIATSTATSAGFYAELTGTTIQNNMDTILIGPPPGWTLVNTCPLFASATAGNESSCGISSVTINGTPVTGWKAYWDGSSPKVRLFKSNAGTGYTSGDAIKVTFAAGAWTSPSTSSTSPFGMTTMYNGGANLDNVTANITVGTPSYTVLFNSNGGSGTMSIQSTSIATALSTNTFTRSGFTFAGWNTAANGTGTAYANGASYAFTSNTTMYAQWTANSSGGSSSSNTLANTGIDSTNGIMFLLGGLSLALIGAEMIMITRRKRSN